MASHCARQYDVWEWLADLEQMVKCHGHDHFYIYRKLCQVKSREEKVFLREVSKSCFLEVLKRTKITALLRSEYNDKIIFIVIVYK